MVWSLSSSSRMRERLRDPTWRMSAPRSRAETATCAAPRSFVSRRSKTSAPSRGAMPSGCARPCAGAVAVVDGLRAATGGRVRGGRCRRGRVDAAQDELFYLDEGLAVLVHDTDVAGDDLVRGGRLLAVADVAVDAPRQRTLERQ